MVFAGSWGLETSEDIPEEDGHEAGFFTVIHEIEGIGCSLFILLTLVMKYSDDENYHIFLLTVYLLVQLTTSFHQFLNYLSVALFSCAG